MLCNLRVILHIVHFQVLASINHLDILFIELLNIVFKLSVIFAQDFKLLEILLSQDFFRRKVTRELINLTFSILKLLVDSLVLPLDLESDELVFFLFEFLGIDNAL